MTEEDLLSRYEYDKEGRNLLKSAVTTDPKIDEETRTRLLSEMAQIDNTTEEVIDEEENQETETLLNEQEPTVEPQSSQEAATPIPTTETPPNADLPSVETATEQPQSQEVIPANEVEQETPASTPLASTTDLQSRGDEIAAKFGNVKFIKPITDESGTPKLQFEYTHKGKNGETLKRSIITILADSNEKALQRKIDNEKLAFKSTKSASTSEGMRAAREKRMAISGDKRSDWIIKRGQLINNIVNEGKVELTDEYLLPKNQGGIAERKEDGTIVFQNETLRKSLKIEEIDGKQYISINRSKKYDPTQKLINMAEGVKVKGGFREEIESENIQEDQSYDVNDIAAVEEEADLDVIEFANEQREKLKNLYVGREDSKEYQDKLKIIDRYVEENLPEGAYVPKATDRALIAEKSPFVKEVEKGIDGLTVTSTSKEYITKGKQLAGKVDGVRFDGIQEGLVRDGKEIFPAQLQFTDQKTKTTFYLPLNSKVTDLQNKTFSKQIEFLKPELKKVFAKLDKLPTIEFTPMAAKYNAVISNDKGETIIRLNSKIQQSEIIPAIEHELFGHFGATKVFELDKELYNYAYQLFQREVNADSDIIKQIKRNYKNPNEEVLFDEWVAFNIEEASKRYFDKDGKFNEQRFKNDETVLNKVIRVIKKLTEKILDKLFNYKPTKKELDNLFIAIIQEFPKITSGEYTGGKRYSVAKEQTTTTETKPKTKRKPPKRYTQEEKEQFYVRDKMRLKNGSGNVKIRFYDFVNKYLYGAGADSYRRQIFELIEEIKDNNDPLINKAIELIDEAIEFRKVSKEFTKLKAFIRRKSVKSNLKEENSDMIDINKRIAEIDKKYQQFVDYQTLKRLKDRGGEVIKPKVAADTVRRLRGSDKYVVVNKETNKITTSERFDTKEAAREWINKNSERVSSNIGEKYESVINQGFVEPISKTDKKRAQKLGLPENTEFDFYQIIKTDDVKERISELKRKLTDSNGKMFDAERIRIEVNKIKEDYRALVSKKEVIKVTKDATLEKAVDDIGVQLKAKKRTDKQIKSSLMWGYKENSKANWLKPFGLVGVNFRYKMQEMDDYDNKGGMFQKYILKPMDENRQKVYEYENELDDGLKNDVQKYDLSYKEMMAMSDQLTVGIVERAFSGDKKKRTRKVKFDNGEIEMSEAREVSLYLISRSERGYKRLTTGGIFIETDELKKTPFKFTENDILNLEKRLNSRQKKLAKVIISHFNRQAEIGNEISMSDIGEKIFTEPNYFPFFVDTDYIDQNKTLARTPDDIRKKFFKGLPSITKERQNSDAPIILEDPFIAVARTRQLFNKYMDMVLVTNKTWTIINNKTFRDNMISNGFGAEYHAIRDDLMDMMTVKPFDSSEDFLKVISSIFTVSVLGYKPTVVLSQPIATVLYFPEMDIDFKEFGIASLNFKNWFEKASIKEIWNFKEHIENLSPYLKKRFNSSMEIIIRGKQTRATAADMFFGGKQFFRGSSFGEKLGSLAKFALSSKGAMSWIQNTDMVGIMGIWKCCEVEAIAKGYKRGTSEFNEYVARRTEHITLMTQQTFDSLDSPPLARTALGRLTTRFLSQTLKNTMMLRKQFFLMNKHGIASKEGFKAGCNSLGIILSQSLAVELLKVGIKAVGGGFDDDEWMTWQYWAKSLSMNVLTLFGMPGIVLSGIVGGYGNVGGGNFGALTERIGDSVRKLKSAISNQDGEAATIAVYELGKTFLPIGGPEQIYKFAKGLVEIWGL
jgi:hypothetical protein